MKIFGSQNQKNLPIKKSEGVNYLSHHLIFENRIPNNEYISNNSSKLRMRQDYLWRTNLHKTDR